MSGSAIAMMILAMAVLWGGLCLAIANLGRSKEGETPEVRRDL
ncbi:MAG TPA: methionine/alanine import family NSS transporter small subunit [Burkholderiaceae bacterium]|nr:methionine/alanine import family NSS transporter small subunit [Burkholderiaceae bacterium]